MAERQQPYEYKSMAEVPDAIKLQLGHLLSVAALSVKQVNAYVRIAYEHQYEQGGVYVPDWGRAKALFVDTYEPERGVWKERTVKGGKR